jgi:energy coupling factor transporter S component ThiW
MRGEINLRNGNVKKLVVAAMMTALIIALSGFYIPVGASKCFPIQHMVNVLSSVLLGPGYGVAIAFCASLIRNLMGTGTLLAFPGSMIGALLCGLTYRYTKKLIPTYAAEIIGTGILGGMVAYPIALLILQNRAAVLFTYVLPFLVSTVGGTLIAAILIAVFAKTKALAYMQRQLGSPVRK